MPRQSRLLIKGLRRALLLSGLCRHSVDLSKYPLSTITIIGIDINIVARSRYRYITIAFTYLTELCLCTVSVVNCKSISR